MDLSLPQLKERRRFWLKGFVLSVVIFAASAAFFFRYAVSLGSAPPGIVLAPEKPAGPHAGSEGSAQPGEPVRPFTPPLGAAPPTAYPVVPLITAVASFVTALVALMGFVYTSVLTWRKERREKVLAELEVEKLRLENDKLRQEMEQTSSSGKPHLDL
jgi:hypothetical protein